MFFGCFPVYRDDAITEKAMSQKECSPVNKFKADEMVTIAKTLNLSFSEFDAIFF